MCYASDIVMYDRRRSGLPSAPAVMESGNISIKNSPLNIFTYSEAALRCCRSSRNRCPNESSNRRSCSAGSTYDAACAGGASRRIAVHSCSTRKRSDTFGEALTLKSRLKAAPLAAYSQGEPDLHLDSGSDSLALLSALYRLQFASTALSRKKDHSTGGRQE